MKQTSEKLLNGTPRVQAAANSYRSSSVFDQAASGPEVMPRVYMMENHDAAYSVWRDAGVRSRVLIHIDAHHDMWWVPENSPTTIANFICPGLKEEMVREIFWVVPDQTWELPTSRRAILRHLKEITAKYPESQRATQAGDRRISTVVLGKPLTICSVDGLPLIDEDVLLDIDIDYLVIPYVSYRERDKHEPLPWRWPDELLSRLRDRKVRSDLATISYSVEGGYTPLKWKYLGDEMAERLREADRTGHLLNGTALLRAGAEASVGGDKEAAEGKYCEAIEILPDFAAAHYHLALLYLETNRIAEARDCYQRATAIDPSYKNALNTAGLLYQSNGHFQKFECDLKRALQLDPEDAYGHYGMGRIAAKRKQWDEAEACLNKSIAIDNQLIDAHRALGRLRVRQGRYDEAIQSYEWSMKLSLAGHAPLDGPIITNESNAESLKDPDHIRIHARLAYLHDLKGEREKAIAGYRISIAAGYDRPWVRARLARLYLKQGEWRKSTHELWQAARSALVASPQIIKCFPLRLR